MPKLKETFAHFTCEISVFPFCPLCSSPWFKVGGGRLKEADVTHLDTNEHVATFESEAHGSAQTTPTQS